MSAVRLDVYEDGGRYHVSWSCRDSGLWHEILDDFKLTFSRHWERTYCPRSRTWSVPSSCLERLEDWANDWFPSDCQRWDDEEEDGEPDVAGEHAVPAQLAAAYKVLHLYPTAPPELVAAAHRILIKAAHPDAGGSHEAAVRVNEAIAVIRAAQRGDPLRGSGRRTA